MNSNLRVIAIVTAQVCLIGFYGHTQNNVNGWLVSSHEQKFAKKWSILLDLQIRSADHFKFVETILIRPALTYNINEKQSIASGYAYFGNWQEEQQNTFELEHRVWEQYKMETKIGKNELINRVRLEQRFLQQEGSYDFSQRLRFYVRFQIPLVKDADFKSGAFVCLQNEIFLNIQNKEKINNRLFDQNRAFAGIGYRWSEAMEIDAGYLYRYQIEETKNSNHIFQLTVTSAL